ncbi:MAG: hypothetical protein J7M05_06635 [Anaerolineae bacterium]|nr:hypothetical protein [Anaerolineae bacterium]
MAITTAISGAYQLTAKLVYGFGLRLIERLGLCVKDIDFTQRQIIVHDGNLHRSGTSRLQGRQGHNALHSHPQIEVRLPSAATWAFNLNLSPPRPSP